MALDVIKRIPQPVFELCGPLNNGGLGSFEANLKRFDEVMIEQSKIHNMFNQVPLEDKIQTINQSYETLPDEKYPKGVLQDFYLPIFKSGMIDTLLFMPGWEDSNGCRWEHQQGREHGIKIEYLN